MCFILYYFEVYHNFRLVEKGLFVLNNAKCGAQKHFYTGTHINFMQYIACFLEKLCFNIVPATLSQIAIFIEFNDIYNAHSSALFKHFTSKTTIDFKYWTNSFHKTDCTANNNISHYINCKRIHEFLHGAFNDVGTHESIKDLLNY